MPEEPSPAHGPRLNLHFPDDRLAGYEDVNDAERLSVSGDGNSEIGSAGEEMEKNPAALDTVGARSVL